MSTSGGLRSIVGYLAGVVLGATCLTLVFLGMRAVMDIGGACADGGPYVSAQACPEGATAALIGGIFGLFGAAGLMIWFGAQLGRGYVALVALGWPALFISLGFNFLQYGTDPPGAETGPVWGWLIPGVMFWFMGGAPLILGIAGWRAARGARSEARFTQLAARMQPRAPDEPQRVEFAPNSWGPARSTPATTPATRQATADDIDEALVSQLERLSSLHASGALTEDEFAAAKARLLEHQRLEP